MQISLDIPIFQDSLEVMEVLEEAGYEAYFVGGCVRDALLNRPIHDVDIATSALPYEVKDLFPVTIDVGIEHGTVLVRHKGQSYEITTFRSEGDYKDHRRPDSVTFVRDLREDLLRRDFTINALAVDRKGRVVDYYDGLGDLKRSCIRCVGRPIERFEEDALRLLRAVRFQSQLDFTIEASTLDAMREKAKSLSYVSVERLTNEWHKTLLSKHYQQALNTFMSTGLYQACPLMKELKSAILHLIKNPIFFVDEADAWTTILYLAQLDSSYTTQLQKSYKLSNKLVNGIKHRLKALRALQDGEWTIWDIYQYGDSFKWVIPLAKQLLPEFHHESAIDMYQNLPIHSKKDMAITGNDLLKAGYRGAEIGNFLDRLERAIVIDKIMNDFESGMDWIARNNRDGGNSKL
ncbi:CCA tRNA nucleotidyltransferase [Atopobacter sp. AH10]|uniref:CCA tRNA nucleotidyltransferase n=1 Tax=Atopobacter sp. AH10 TaxID=2315861 RepID=UPI000EF21949|nr:CCA tRNA nucleotidyltransferase [Atopobacter sp. AH10]RLK63205.1 CCA tRNA nucleotidyltransferase [Atopobacter sp. AH10]